MYTQRKLIYFDLFDQQLLGECVFNNISVLCSLFRSAVNNYHCLSWVEVLTPDSIFFFFFLCMCIFIHIIQICFRITGPHLWHHIRATLDSQPH